MSLKYTTLNAPPFCFSLSSRGKGSRAECTLPLPLLLPLPLPLLLHKSNGFIGNIFLYHPAIIRAHEWFFIVRHLLVLVHCSSPPLSFVDLSAFRLLHKLVGKVSEYKCFSLFLKELHLNPVLYLHNPINIFRFGWTLKCTIKCNDIFANKKKAYILFNYKFKTFVVWLL